jgi:type I restriction enzyme S subunit
MSKAWQMRPLGEMLTERREAPSVEALAKGEIRIVAKIGFNDGKIQLRNGTETKTGMILVRPGDLLISGINAAKGAIAIYGEENPDPIAATIHYGAYIPKKDRVDVQYLWWLLRSKIFRDLLERYVPGGIKTELKAKRFLPIPVPLPSLEEQRRIVAKIDALSDIIHRAHALHLKAAEETSVLFSRLRANKFKALENRFSNRPLGSLICMASGEGLTSSQMDDGAPYPVYGGGGLTGRYSQYLFKEPKIAIGRVGARCGCVFVTAPKSWITDNALYLSEISSDLHPPYLVHALSTLDIRQQANQAAQPVVSQKRINPLTIPVPPISEQQRIVGELDALRVEVDALTCLQAKISTELDALMPSILDKAFKGEL